MYPTKENLEFILKHNQIYLEKISKLHDAYLDEKKSLYNHESIIKITKAFGFIKHKSTLLTIHLEGLWKESEIARREILLDYDNSTKEHRWTDIDKTIGSLRLEAFLFQAKAFLDAYVMYCLLLLKVRNLPKKTLSKFEVFEDVPREFTNPAQKVKDYFSKIVYGSNIDWGPLGSNGWGRVVKSMRDKIAHTYYINSDSEGVEVIQDIILKWPTLRGMTYERFCQSVENGIFYMIVEISEILYEVDWNNNHN
jgi:hypothetical protein